MKSEFRKRYIPKNPEKYAGNVRNIIARSMWEYRVFQWMDQNSRVVKWSSEEVIIPYVCKTDGQIHRYFMDIKYKNKDGKTFLIEIKPRKQTQKPVRRKYQQEKSYIHECLTYAKNVSKWEAAQKYCKQRGWTFQIWDETILEKIGIVGIKPFKPFKRLPPKRPKKTNK